MNLLNKNKEVTHFLDQQDHPFRMEIEYLRNVILSSNSDLKENVKWNGPNYHFLNQDLITMRIQPPVRQIQLIFHRGAKKQEQHDDKFIINNSKLLTWKTNDRAVISFKSLGEIKENLLGLNEIIEDWVTASKQFK